MNGSNDKNSNEKGYRVRDEEYEEKPLTLKEKVVKEVRKKIPILSWLPKYDRSNLIGDFIAGITVGTTAVPQVMAYAALAGLPPEYGLYSSFVAPIIYVALGTCPQVALGTTAVISLMTYQTCGDGYPNCVVLAAFWTGLFELILGLFGLGFIVSLISEPAAVGFISAVACTVASSQLKNVLGLTHVPRKPGSSKDGFFGHLWFAVENRWEIHYSDLALALCCISTLVFLQHFQRFIKPTGPRMAKAFWIICQCRNVFVVFTTTLIALLWTDRPFEIIRKVRGGFPPVGPPPFLLPVRPSSVANYTGAEGEVLPVMSFGETMAFLQAGPIIIGVVSILQNVAISKAYGSGQRIDGNQEMFALGVANIAGSFFSAQPTAGAFSRAALSKASGVRTPLAGIFTASLVLAALGLVTPAFRYIPKASLGSVIMSAVVGMVEYQKVLPLWRLSKPEFFTSLITFVVSLFVGMEFGMMIGVGISIMQLLYNLMSAKLTFELRRDDVTNVDYIFIGKSVGLRFPSVDLIRKYIMKSTLRYPNTICVVIDCKYWTSLDFTAAYGIQTLIKSLRAQGKYLILLNLGEFEDQWRNALLVSSGGELDPNLINCINVDNNISSNDGNNNMGRLFKKILPEESQPLADVVVTTTMM